MAIKCEICGSTNVLKHDGLFICQKCGTKYSIEEAKKLLIEEQAATSNIWQIDNYTKRLFLFLEDKNWKEANLVCEKILDIDSENATAYLGKLFIDYHISNFSEMANMTYDFSENVNYKRIVRFGSEDLIKQVNQYLENIKAQNKIKIEQKTIKAEQTKKTAIKLAKWLAPFVAVILIIVLLANCVIVPNIKYNHAQNLYDTGSYENALQIFESLENWKDSKTKSAELKKIIKEKNYIIYKNIQVQFPSTAEYSIWVDDDKIFMSGNNIPTINKFLSYLQAPKNCKFFEERNEQSVYATFLIEDYLNARVKYALNDLVQTEMMDLKFMGGYKLDEMGLVYQAKYTSKSNRYPLYVTTAESSGVIKWFQLNEWDNAVKFLGGETVIKGQYFDAATRTNKTTFTITVVVRH